MTIAIVDKIENPTPTSSGRHQCGGRGVLRFGRGVAVDAAAEPVGVGRVGVADGGVHRAVDAGGGGALAVALGLRDHLPNW